MKKLTFIFVILSLSKSIFSQNVGIGTSSPQGIIHLKGTNWVKTIFENNTGEARGYVGSDNNGTITLASNAYWDGSTWQYPNTGSSMYLLLHRANNQFEFRVRPDGGVQSTPMVIEVGGNVGIGTTAPQQNLSVGSGAVIDQNNTNIGTPAGMLSFGSVSGEGIGSKRNAGGNQSGLDFYTSHSPRMSITNSGNVGIGVSNPLTKLDVNGSVRIGNSSVNEIGSIRYNAGNFEGYSAGMWASFDQLPKGTIVSSAVYPNDALEQKGFVFRAVLPDLLKREDKIGAALNSWEPLATQLLTDPLYRYDHCQVWNGNDLLVWGGSSSATNTIGFGRKYSPVNNLWTSISTVNEPANRKDAVAFWSGAEMLIWGGLTYNGGSETFEPINTGGKYDAFFDTWSAISNVNAPSIRMGFSGVWTGTEMIIWGGHNGTSPLNTGAKYNPATNTWTSISTINAPAARNLHSAVWTGTEMIIWGGFDGTAYINTGAKYNPTTNTWTAISTLNAPSSRYGHTVVFTGSEMIIWGGRNPAALASGAKYNTNTDSWTTLNTTNASGPVREHSAIWNGSFMYVWGGDNGMGGSNSVVYRNMYRYAPSTNSWSSFAAADTTLAISRNKMTWADNQIIIYGGILPGFVPSHTGFRFFPAALPAYNLYNYAVSNFYLYSKE